MAFAIPQHLPRKGRAEDVSSQILTKIGEASSKELNAKLAETWIEELEGNIQSTKERIYECVRARLPDFEQQLETSKSVQTRLKNLTEHVDSVSNAFSHPETGLLPILVRSLTEHSALAQKASDAAVLNVAVAHLVQCRAEYRELSRHVKDGRLPEAVKSNKALQELLHDAPEAVAKAEVMADMKRKLRIVTDTIEEQLSDAYVRSIRISSTELSVSLAIQIRQSQTTISLSNLLSSLSPNSLSSHLASLRRDLITHFVEFPIQQRVKFTIANEKDLQGIPLQRLSIFPSSDRGPANPSTLTYLRALFDFLSSDIFSHLPGSIRESFPRSLCKPTTDALLNQFLIPSQPSSLDSLASFISLAKETAIFETALVSTLCGTDANIDLDISGWVDNLKAHYGRKRRVDLLKDARNLVVSTKEHAQERIFRAEVAQKPTVDAVEGRGLDVVNTADGWDFEEQPERAATSRPEYPGLNGRSNPAVQDEVTWDFDDDAEGEDAASQPPRTNGNHAEMEQSGDADVDAEDAWGWGDDEAEVVEEDAALAPAANEEFSESNDIKTEETPEDDPSAWDDAWGDSGTDPAIEQFDTPALHPPPSQPKAAKKLERFSAKSKGGQASVNATSTQTIASSSTVNGQRPVVGSSATSSRPPVFSKPPAHVPPPLTSLPLKTRPRETYSISGRAKDIVALVTSVLAEGREVHHSSVFDCIHGHDRKPNTNSSPSSSPSFLISHTAPSVLDLYRALYPVVFAAELARFPDRAMRFANDCIYISTEVHNLLQGVGIDGKVFDESGKLRDALSEAAERTKGLGEWWFGEVVEKQCSAVRSTLDRAEGFVDTGEQERFDECEAVMIDISRKIKTVGSQWKLVLPRSKYFSAVGAVTEAALTKILDDVLALGDIPELDSRRLSELCRILNAVEGLFVDDSDPEMPSMVVAYVPSWLKFSYLSELLEASIADISYLFDAGALIDFEVDELVTLVRALFADTPLRTNTIAKLMRGHPVPAT